MLCDEDDRYGSDLLLYRLNESKATAWVAAKVLAAARAIALERKDEAQAATDGSSFAVASTTIDEPENKLSSKSQLHATPASAASWPSREHMLDGLKLIAQYAEDRWVFKAAKAFGISRGDLCGTSQARKRFAPASIQSLEAKVKSDALA